MNAATRHDFFWRLALGLMLLNLVNMALWAVGWYVHPAVYAALAVLVIAFSKWPTNNITTVMLLVGVFTAIALSGPITDWDARSIWFFHAKRIFLDNGLYAQLDNYAGWSHNDYPVLVPAVAASVARSVGHWNEVFPRLGVVMVLLPAILALAWTLNDRIAFNLFASAMLLMSGKFLLNGYMDAVVAVYCACACVLLAQMWERREAITSNKGIPAYLALFVLAVSNLIFLKNEGLLAALLLWICALPALWHRWKWLAFSLVPFALYAVLWRIPLAVNQIQGDLFVAGIFERTLTKVQDPMNVQAIGAALLENSSLYFLALLGALTWAFKRGRFMHAVPIAAFVLLYTLAIVAVYVVAPNDLTWHLATSANRTLMTTNLCVVAGVLYLSTQRA